MTTDQNIPATGTTTPTAREGAPAWIDLGTNDAADAQRFYGELFGWTFHDQGEEFGHYRLIRSGDDLVGGLMDTTGMTCPEGGELPPQWGVYLCTPDIDAALGRVDTAGGRVTMPAMPVADRGAMALALDPAGAVVGLWRPGVVTGMDLPLRHATPVWFEVMSTDYDAALPFYRDVFGWDVAEMGGEGFRYATHGADADAAAGLCDAAGVLGDGVGSFWRVYLAYDGLDAGLARVTELGGAVLDGPTDSPYGRMATVRDPQGATFQLIEAAGSCPS